MGIYWGNNTQIMLCIPPIGTHYKLEKRESHLWKTKQIGPANLQSNKKHNCDK